MLFKINHLIFTKIKTPGQFFFVMSFFVCIASDLGPNISIDSEQIKGATANEIQSKFKLEASNLFLCAPNYVVCLSPDEIPLDICPQLSSTKKLTGSYDRPDFFLLQSSYIDPDSFFLTVNMKISEKNNDISKDSKNNNKENNSPDKNSQLIKFYVSINVNDYDKITANDIISNLSNTLDFQFIPNKFFINGKLVNFDEKVECIDFPDIKIKCNFDDNAMKKIVHRENVIKEIIDTENDYLDDLNQILNFWAPQIKIRRLFEDSEFDFIFKDIQSIYTCHNEFYTSLKNSYTGYSTPIGKVFLEFIDILRVSIHFISSFSKIQKIIDSKRTNKSFFNALNELQEKIDGKDLMSYLITPVQRIPRYLLFMREICKITPTSHPDHILAQLALEKIEELAKSTDTQSERVNQQELLCQIQEKLKKNNISIVDPYRRIIKQYDVKVEILSNYHHHLNNNTNATTVLPINPYKSKFKFGTLYLCNDSIMIIKDKGKTASILYRTHITLFHYRPALGDFTSLIYTKCESENKTQANTINNVLYSEVKLTFNTSNELNDFLSNLMILMNEQLKQIGNYRFLIWSLDALSEMIPNACKMASITGKDMILFSGGVEVEGVHQKHVNILSTFKAYERDTLKRSNEIVSIIKTTESGQNGTGRYNHSMCYLDGSLYIIGGYKYFNGVKNFDNEISKLCISSGQWSKFCINENISLVGHTAVSYNPNHSIYIFGGKNKKKERNSSLLKLDTINNTITEIKPKTKQAPWPTPRCYHSMILFKNKIVVFGGSNSVGNLLNDLWEFNIDTESWNRIDIQNSLVFPRKKHMAFLIGNEMIILSGITTDSVSFTISIDLTNYTVSDVVDSGNFPFCLRSASGGIIDDSLVIYGGIEDKNPLNMVYTIHISQTWIDKANSQANSDTNSSFINDDEKINKLKNIGVSADEWQTFSETKKSFSVLTRRSTSIPKVIVKSKKVPFRRTDVHGKNALMYRSMDRFSNLPLSKINPRSPIYRKNRKYSKSISPKSVEQMSNTIKTILNSNPSINHDDIDFESYVSQLSENSVKVNIDIPQQPEEEEEEFLDVELEHDDLFDSIQVIEDIQIGNSEENLNSDNQSDNLSGEESLTSKINSDHNLISSIQSSNSPIKANHENSVSPSLASLSISPVSPKKDPYMIKSPTPSITTPKSQKSQVSPVLMNSILIKNMINQEEEIDQSTSQRKKYPRRTNDSEIAKTKNGVPIILPFKLRRMLKRSNEKRTKWEPNVNKNKDNIKLQHSSSFLLNDDKTDKKLSKNNPNQTLNAKSFNSMPLVTFLDSEPNNQVKSQNEAKNQPHKQIKWKAHPKQSTKSGDLSPTAQVNTKSTIKVAPNVPKAPKKATLKWKVSNNAKKKFD